MTFTTGGYLEERMHATSVLASAIGSLAAIPVLWKQYKKMKACSRNRKTVECGRGSRLYSAGYDLRPSPEYCNERDRLYRIFSGYQDMASKIYEGQNPLLLILSVGVLSAAAGNCFRGMMIYRRAKISGNRLGHRSIMSAVRCISRQCDAVCLCSRGKCF